MRRQREMERKPENKEMVWGGGKILKGKYKIKIS